MSLTPDITTIRRCTGCGHPMEVGDHFCSSCGVRQIDEDAQRVPEPIVEPDPPTHPGTTAWVLAGLVAAGILVLAIGIVVGSLGAGLPGAMSGDGDAAEAMDRYAPLAEGWREKHQHVAEEAEAGDANGLSVAAVDAHEWIDVNDEDLRDIAASADGASRPYWDDLVEVFDQRYSILVDIADTAADGTGEAAVAATGDEMGQLDVLDVEAETAACGIADVIRQEGGDPSDHITPAMDVDC
jgi:hypothetical protein